MSMTPPETGRPASRRAEYFTYTSGMVNDSQTELIGFVIPLYALFLGMSPFELGMLVSSKSVLSSILSIHSGVLMDRFGTRRVMLAMGAACTFMPPLFAVSGWFPFLLILQMALGAVLSFGWIGSQALAVYVGRNDPRVVGRFSFFARVGVMMAPVAGGLMWDYLPYWVSFVVGGAMGGVFWLSVNALPPKEVGEDPDKATERPPFRLRDILPSLSDYIGAIGLLVIPMVAFVVTVSSVRIGTALLQNSFYLVYLKELGLSATVIGLFVTLSQLMAATGTLSSAWFQRFMHPHWLFLGMVVTSVTSIYVTPIFGSVLALLALAIAIRGFAQGASQPVMYTILSRAVSREIQATAIGLRATGNRVAGIILPLILGGVAELWGLSTTFYVTGGLLLSILAAAGIWIAVKQPRSQP
jgi:MFS family permease